MQRFSASKTPGSLKDFGGKEAWLAPPWEERLAGVSADPRVPEPTPQDWSRAKAMSWSTPGSSLDYQLPGPQHCREAGPLPSGHPGPFSKATPVGTL